MLQQKEDEVKALKQQVCAGAFRACGTLCALAVHIIAIPQAASLVRNLPCKPKVV